MSQIMKIKYIWKVLLLSRQLYQKPGDYYTQELFLFKIG